MHRVEVTNEPALAADRDTVGGAPYLPSGLAHPRCKLCDQPMVLFLQFDIRPEFKLPFASGSHFLAFMCPQHNDAAFAPDPFDKSPLRSQYWEQDVGHYSLLLLPDGASTSAGAIDGFLEPRRIRFEQATENVADNRYFSYGSHEFKVGGVPGWLNYAPTPKCSCGGTMQFVVQFPDSFGFRQRAEAPEQPKSFSRTEYCFLLGNAVFVLACDKQCDARAVIAYCDN
jgi:hypothetical protein